MNYIQYAFTYVPLLWKRVLMLLAELASCTYAFNLSLFESRESHDDSFRLHHLEFIEIDVANPLVLQLYVDLGFGAFCKHG